MDKLLFEVVTCECICIPFDRNKMVRETEFFGGVFSTSIKNGVLIDGT